MGRAGAVAPVPAGDVDVADYRERTDALDDGSVPAHESAGGFEQRCLRVGESLHGQRLDKALVQLAPEFSRSHLQSLVERGHVRVDGLPALASAHKLRAGQQLEIELVPTEESRAFTAEAVPLHILFEDDDLMVLAKPAGLVVHPAAGNWSGTLLNGLLYRYGQAAADLPRAGIVHRLDKETSGLMVVARTLVAQTDLVRQLQARTVKRHYAALVWGRPPQRTVVGAPIGRDPRERTRMAVVPGQGGKPARTRVVTVASAEWEGSPVSLVLCSLDTGRTHQIRVHLSHLGHALLGDPLYKPRHKRPVLPGDFARQALHAWRLGLIHPEDGRLVHWQAPLPDDLRALVAALGLEFDFSTLPDSLDDFFPA